MANDRMYLKCKGCGKTILLAKTFCDGYVMFHTTDEYNAFFEEHAFCNSENDNEGKYQDFTLEYESEGY